MDLGGAMGRGESKARRWWDAFQVTDPCVRAWVKITTEPALTLGVITNSASS